MRVIVLNTQNNLLAGAIVKYLRERGGLLPERVTNPENKDEPLSTCLTVGASVLLMEVSKISPFTPEERLLTAEQLRAKLPECRIAILCDDRANPEFVSLIKDAKKLKQIDAFFYSSVTGEYLCDALDTL